MAESFEVKDSVWIGADKRIDSGSVHPAVLETVEEMNAGYGRDPSAFWQRLDLSLRPSGRRRYDSSIIFKEKGDSKTHCVIGQPPFVTSLLPHERNPSSYNTVIKNYLLDRTNRRREFRAPDGRRMSTVLASGPDRDHSPWFSPLEALKITRGDFSPYAKRVIAVVKRHGFEAAYFFGVSRASSVGAAALRIAGQEEIDGLGGAFAEPTNFEQTVFWQPAVNFTREFAPGTEPENLHGHWWDDGPQVMLELQAEHGDGSFVGNYLGGNLLASAIGFSHDRFIRDIRYLGCLGIPTAIGYGENSAMSHRLPEVAAADESIRDLVKDGLVHLLAARGPASSHGFTENHLAYAAIISDGLQVIKQRNI